jgi:lipopolysaccharide/colanic/teichoic acid biosynthesis glycosyltransferase
MEVKNEILITAPSEETSVPQKEPELKIYLNKKPVYGFFKRLLDIVLSIIGLIICALPMAIIALLIRAGSPGGAIYVHNRIGKNGKTIPLLKFRTMYNSADEMLNSFTSEQKAEWQENFKLDNDPRVTKIGKFLRRSSLDELPQLVNILKGDLSIVGPRPIVTEELEKYGDNKEAFLSVPPGLTGYWQAYARSTCTYEQRMEMELYYVENANFWWDIKIIFATVGAVLRGRGAM